LSALVTRTSSTKAKIIFSGQAASHSAGSSSQVEVTCGDDAFAGGNAASVIGAGNIITINFV
jgi:hypothetical protein